MSNEQLFTPESVTQCPTGHPLVESQSSAGGPARSCHLCARLIASGPLWSCRSCDFNRCPACHKLMVDSLPGSTAPESVLISAETPPPDISSQTTSASSGPASVLADVAGRRHSEGNGRSPSPGGRGQRSRCSYGARCYQQHPDHRSQFSHPGDLDYDAAGSQPRHSAPPQQSLNTAVGGFLAPRCNNAHPLQCHGIGGVGWRCDMTAIGECQNSSASFANSVRFRCARCDFDLCENCYMFRGGQIPLGARLQIPSQDMSYMAGGAGLQNTYARSRSSGGGQPNTHGTGSRSQMSLASRQSGGAGSAGGGAYYVPRQRPEKLIDYEVEDCLPDDPCYKLACGCGFLVFLTLIILFFPCTVTQIGQYKVGLLRNKISGKVVLDNVYSPGRYWIGFWKDFIEFPTTLRTIEFSDDEPEETLQDLSSLRARDRDGKHIYLDLSIQYHLKQNEVGEVYRDLLTIYEDLYISLLRDAFNKALNQLAVQQIWEDGGLRQSLFATCQAVLDLEHAVCWGLQLQGVRLDSAYEAALTRTQVKKQAKRVEDYRKLVTVVRWDTKVMLASYTKNITLLKANGDAKVYKLNREAITIAQANLIRAQAKSIQLVKETVHESATSAHSVLTLDPLRLVEYQKLVMLHSHRQAHFIKDGAANAGQRRLAQRLLEEGDDPALSREDGKMALSSRRLLAHMLLSQDSSALHTEL